MNRPTDLQNNPKSSHGGSLLVLSLLATTLISGFVLASSTTSADASTSSSATASVTVGSACSLTSSIDTAHTATISPGTYYDGDNNEGIGKTTIKITCNDVEGFALYAVGYTNDTFGTTTLNGTNTGQTIATGTAKSGNTSNWAMKLSTTSTPTPAYPIEIANGTNLPDNFTDYHAVPSTYTKVAYRNSGTDTGDNTTGSTLTTTYAAYIAGTQPADTYSGKVKYTMVHPASNTPKDGPMACASNKICYSPSANDVIGTMGQQDASADTEITLLASNFSRKGYGFAGWSDAYDYETNPNANFYGPNEDYTTPSDMTRGKTLYAVWVESAGSLQDSTKVVELCGTGAGSLTQSGPNVTRTLASVSALTDQRDNETYAIAKLADSNCWMIENLRLEAEATRGNNQYDSSKTNQSLAQGYNSSFTGLADAEAPWGNARDTANSLYSTDGSTENTISGGDSRYLGYRFPRYNNYNNQSSSTNRPQNPRINAAINANTNAGMYSYGNYYTWAAAIADTTDYTTTSFQAFTNTSICPSGWHVPYGYNGTGTGGGDTSGGFYYLGSQMGATTNNAVSSKIWRNYPNNFIYSGRVYGYAGGSVNNRSYAGYYRSSMKGELTSYYLGLRSNRVTLTGQDETFDYYLFHGQSIRCVASGS